MAALEFAPKFSSRTCRSFVRMAFKSQPEPSASAPVNTLAFDLLDGATSKFAPSDFFRCSPL